MADENRTLIAKKIAEIETQIQAMKTDIGRLRTALLPSKMMTVEELAEYLAVNPYTVRRLQKANHIPSYKVGRVVRFKLDDVMSSLNHSEVDPF